MTTVQQKSELTDGCLAEFVCVGMETAAETEPTDYECPVEEGEEELDWLRRTGFDFLVCDEEPWVGSGEKEWDALHSLSQRQAAVVKRRVMTIRDTLQRKRMRDRQRKPDVRQIFAAAPADAFPADAFPADASPATSYGSEQMVVKASHVTAHHTPTDDSHRDHVTGGGGGHSVILPFTDSSIITSTRTNNNNNNNECTNTRDYTNNNNRKKMISYSGLLFGRDSLDNLSPPPPLPPLPLTLTPVAVAAAATTTAHRPPPQLPPLVLPVQRTEQSPDDAPIGGGGGGAGESGGGSSSDYPADSDRSRFTSGSPSSQGYYSCSRSSLDQLSPDDSAFKSDFRHVLRISLDSLDEANLSDHSTDHSSPQQQQQQLMMMPLSSPDSADNDDHHLHHDHHLHLHDHLQHEQDLHQHHHLQFRDVPQRLGHQLSSALRWRCRTMSSPLDSATVTEPQCSPAAAAVPPPLSLSVPPEGTRPPPPPPLAAPAATLLLSDQAAIHIPRVRHQWRHQSQSQTSPTSPPSAAAASPATASPATATATATTAAVLSTQSCNKDGQAVCWVQQQQQQNVHHHHHQQQQQQQRLGVTRIDHLSAADAARVQQLALLEFTGLLDEYGVSYRCRRWPLHRRHQYRHQRRTPRRTRYSCSSTASSASSGSSNGSSSADVHTPVFGCELSVLVERERVRATLAPPDGRTFVTVASVDNCTSSTSDRDNDIDSDSDSDSVAAVPSVFQCMVSHLERHGLLEEGVLRVPANSHRLELVRQRIASEVDAASCARSGSPPATALAAILADCSVNEVAALFKLFLRQLPTPLLTDELMYAFTAVHQLPGQQLQLQALQLLCLQLPAVNRAVLRRLLQLLQRVALHEDKNRMSLDSCALIMAPNLIYPPASVRRQKDIRAEVEFAAVSSAVVCLLIEHRRQMWTVPAQFVSQVRRQHEDEHIQRARKLSIKNSKMRLLRRRREAAVIMRKIVNEVDYQQGVIRVDAPQFNKSGMPVRLTCHTTAADVVARCSQETVLLPELSQVLRTRYFHQHNDAILDDENNRPAICNRAKMAPNLSAILKDHFLYEQGGNIDYRRLDHSAFVLDCYQQNPNSQWVVRCCHIADIHYSSPPRNC